MATRAHHRGQDEEEPVVKSYWWPEQSNIDIGEVEKGYFSLITLSSSVVYIIPIFSFLTYLVFINFKDLIHQIWNDLVELLFSLIAAKYFLYEIYFFVLLTTLVVWYLTKSKDIYLVDFAVWPGNPKFETSNAAWIKLTKESGFFDDEACAFQARVSAKTGLGDQTQLPPGILSRPPSTTMQLARLEAQEVIFTTVDLLFAATKVKPTDIDILIVNCSLFCPTPSLASMVINKYKMKQNICSLNLGGMGCSAGIIAIDLAKDLLQTHKNSLALIISTENITQNWYKGREKGMMLQNSLFRCGGAAVLLSNRWKDYWRSKYQLLHTVRIHKGASDKAYKSVYQEEDENLEKGVRLSKDLMDVVGDALKSNMTVLGPLVLPWSEHIKFFYYYLYGRMQKKLGNKPPPPYVPDFTKAFQHFCIHAGGRAILDGLEENLKLSPKHVEPSRATLYRYGNTSSSSVWYELAYSERMGLIKSGHTVWQIALGSGFKCNSAVWKSLCTIQKSSSPPSEKLKP